MASQVEDLSRKRIMRLTAEGLGAYLQVMRLTEKKIWQLRMSELESISEAVVSAWIIAESKERIVRDQDPVPEAPSDFRA